MSNHYRITGEFITLSPLSHIGESISTNSYLVEEPILQEDGGIENVFSYSGNAWRGQLRDLSASYMLEKLNASNISLDAFHLLFSGGKIGGEQSIDLTQARLMRRTVPMISVFGGGVGNQILPGKLRVGSSYPVCNETRRILPDIYDIECDKTSYRMMTTEKSFTRFDDSKNPELVNLLPQESVLFLESGEKKQKKDGDVSTQMRMTSELIIAGVKLVHEIDMMNCTEIELGVLVSAIHEFAKSPYIGGQGNKGHGKVSYKSKIVNMRTGEVNDFCKISRGDACKLSAVAASAKESYDTHLREQYEAYLSSKESEIAGLLGA